MRDERLALAGLHLGDFAFVQHLAAHDLDVEVAHAERAFAGLAYDRKRLRQASHRASSPSARRSLELGGLRGQRASSSAEIAGSNALVASDGPPQPTDLALVAVERST